MKFRLDPRLFDDVGKAREREWRNGLMDLNAEVDGNPPTVTLRRRADGGVDFVIAEAGQTPVELPLPHVELARSFRDYREIIERLSRAGAGTFGMRDFETLDYAKKLIHDEAGDIVRQRLAPRLAMEHRVARRVFTLVFLVSCELPEHLVTNHRRHGWSGR